MTYNAARTKAADKITMTKGDLGHGKADIEILCQNALE